MTSMAHSGGLAQPIAPPPILDLTRISLFADLDGTLAPIEATPQEVRPDADRRVLIDALRDALSGCFAVVSGRGLADIDRLLEQRVPAVAAVHGLVRRSAEGEIVADAVGAPSLQRAFGILRRFAADRPGLIIEDKGPAIALHYRQAPGQKRACHALARRLAVESGLEILEGHCVIELRLAGPDKGRATAAFMAEQPFEGRRPIFLGDDLTDESGFETALALGGFGVIVGRGRPTAARYALRDVEAVHAWLKRALARAPK